MTTFTLTVDVEPDAVYPTWKTSSPITFNGVFEGVSILQNLVSQFNVNVTYFIQPIILYDNKCVNFFSNLKGEFELATHLHGDYIEPSSRYSGPDFSGCDPHDKQIEYTQKIEFAKMKNLTLLFHEKFGYNPVSFRAGRFGSGKNTCNILKALGYTHDSSVVPGHKQFKKQINLNPYMQDGVIEVPVTCFKGRWLRPTPGYSSGVQMKELIESLPITNFCCMFHNVELVPGMSPYCKTKNECILLIDALSSLFEYCVNKNINFLSLSKIKI